MQFKVPQFLEIEDKIFGPFTFKQFVYLVGGAGFCYVFYKLLGVWLGGIPITLVAILSLSLAFYKPNGKPFIEMLEAWIKFTSQKKLYIWEAKKPRLNEHKILKEKMEEKMQKDKSKLDGNKLRDLAWSLDVLDVNKNK